MYASEIVHVVKGSDHLGHKEATGILAHGTHGLTQVKEEASLNVLHDDEDEVVNDATWWLDDLSGITEVHHADDSAMIEILKDGDLVLDREDRVFVTTEEFFFQNLDCDLFSLGFLDRAR